MRDCFENRKAIKRPTVAYKKRFGIIFSLFICSVGGADLTVGVQTESGQPGPHPGPHPRPTLVRAGAPGAPAGLPHLHHQRHHQHQLLQLVTVKQVSPH